MTPIKARRDLEQAIRERGADLATASKALGYNHAYLQQFVSLGKPKYLHEQDRERLAELYKIDTEALKPPPKKLPNSRALASADAPSQPPRIGDPINDAQEAAIIHTWRQLPKKDKELIIGMMNVALQTRGLPTIAA